MNSPAKNTRKTGAATGQEIRSILGPVNDDLVTEILSIKAEAHEVREALEWLENADYLATKSGKNLNTRVARIYKILEQDRELQQQRDR